MSEHKQAAIWLSKYNLMEYLDYFDLLRYSHEIYLQQGDAKSAQHCLELISQIPSELEDVKSHTSSLGLMILEQPELDIPDEYSDWLEEHGII